jgi:hypothetical protein
VLVRRNGLVCRETFDGAGEFTMSKYGLEAELDEEDAGPSAVVKVAEVRTLISRTLQALNVQKSLMTCV